MIDKTYNGFILVCDICGEQLGKTFDYFHDAARARDANGWTTEKTEHGWIDICEECQE